jgi:hypothetical protein
MLFAMAWRNPRRTLLTLGAVAGGLGLMIAMYGMTRAMGDRLIEGLTGSFMGHVQLHREGYREKRSATSSVPGASVALKAIRETPGVAAAAGRVYGFAHASFVRGDDDEVRHGGGQDVASPVVALLGLEPEVTNLSEHMVEGSWLEAIYQSLKRRKERLSKRLQQEKTGLRGRQILAETIPYIPEDDDDLDSNASAPSVNVAKGQIAGAQPAHGTARPAHASPRATWFGLRAERVEGLLLLAVREIALATR